MVGSLAVPCSTVPSSSQVVLGDGLLEVLRVERLLQEGQGEEIVRDKAMNNSHRRSKISPAALEQQHVFLFREKRGEASPRKKACKNTTLQKYRGRPSPAGVTWRAIRGGMNIAMLPLLRT